MMSPQIPGQHEVLKVLIPLLVPPLLRVAVHLPCSGPWHALTSCSVIVVMLLGNSSLNSSGMSWMLPTPVTHLPIHIRNPHLPLLIQLPAE